MSNETWYGIPTALIALGLFVAMTVALEVGLRVGRRQARTTSQPFRDHVNAIQSALLGLLALVLAFTFSLALQRYDSRSDAIVDEANAIGTAIARADLLSPAGREEAIRVFTSYVDVRVAESTLPVTDRAARERANARAAQVRDSLWEIAARESRAAPTQQGPSLFAQAVNAVGDSHGKRNAALGRHVPEIVLQLLALVLVCSGGIVGYSSGIAGHRPSMVTAIMLVLIVVLVFITLDLDRPRRGVIQVDHSSLVELQTGLRRAGATPPAGGSTQPAAVPAEQRPTTQ